MQEHAGTFDFILDTVSADHDINAYLNMLGLDGNITLVGAPEKPLPVSAFALLFGRKSVSGSLIGGIAETQEMLDFCGEHGITADVEMIPIQQVNEAYERMLKSDVKYRFSIDMASLDANRRMHLERVIATIQHVQQRLSSKRKRRRDMGLFDFIKDAGEKVFGKDEDPKEAAAALAAAKAKKAAVEARRVQTLTKYVGRLGLEIDDLGIAVDGDVVVDHGTVVTQEVKEKIVLALGNTAGTARVDDRITVEVEEPEAIFHTVVSGDSLSKIAKEYYGDPMKYPVIFEANKPMLSDPDKIYRRCCGFRRLREAGGGRFWNARRGALPGPSAMMRAASQPVSTRLPRPAWSPPKPLRLRLIRYLSNRRIGYCPCFVCGPCFDKGDLGTYLGF